MMIRRYPWALAPFPSFIPPPASLPRWSLRWGTRPPAGPRYHGTAKGCRLFINSTRASVPAVVCLSAPSHLGASVRCISQAESEISHEIWSRRDSRPRVAPHRPSHRMPAASDNPVTCDGPSHNRLPSLSPTLGTWGIMTAHTDKIRVVTETGLPFQGCPRSWRIAVHVEAGWISEDLLLE